MRFSDKLVELARLNRGELLTAILERRTAIREHRDQKGDDRCWLDDYPVWGMVHDLSSASLQTPSSPPPSNEAMRRCREFYRFRRAETADSVPVGAISDQALWDEDIFGMTRLQLIHELYAIQLAIVRHRDIDGRPRTVSDDRLLYGVLPEKNPADFRLPPEEEFLGEARAPNAGCPAFWRSHGNCPSACHDLHKWGPCK